MSCYIVFLLKIEFMGNFSKYVQVFQQACYISNNIFKSCIQANNLVIKYP